LFFLFVFTTIFITQNQKKKNVRTYVNVIPLKIYALLYRRVGAGAAGARAAGAGAASKFLLGARAA
jgi:hypothetical protein